MLLVSLSPGSAPLVVTSQSDRLLPDLEMPAGKMKRTLISAFLEEALSSKEF